MYHKLIENKNFNDDRGIFKINFGEMNHQFSVKQVNVVHTYHQGTLRGLHFQYKKPQAKYISVIQGRIQDVIVDLDTLRYYSFNLDTKYSLYVPKNYAHSYLVLEPFTVVSYLVDEDYHPEYENGIRWNDPRLNIPWLIDKPNVSERDQSWGLL